jgi:hypothetical protein
LNCILGLIKTEHAHVYKDLENQIVVFFFFFPLSVLYGQATAVSAPKASFRRQQLNQILITAEELLKSFLFEWFLLISYHGFAATK